MHFPSGRFAISTSGTNSLSVELQVLARGNVFEMNFSMVLEGSEHHFLVVVVVVVVVVENLSFAPSWCDK